MRAAPIRRWLAGASVFCLVAATTFLSCCGDGTSLADHIAEQSGAGGAGQASAAERNEAYGDRIAGMQQQRAGDQRSEFFSRAGQNNAVEVVVTGVTGDPAAAGVYLRKKLFKAAYSDYADASKQAAGALQMLMARYDERLGRLADYCAQFDELPHTLWRFRISSVIDFPSQLPAVLMAMHCPRIEAKDFQSHFERARAHRAERDVFEPRPLGRAFALPVWQRWAPPEIERIPHGTDLAQAGDHGPSFAAALGAPPAGELWHDDGEASRESTAGEPIAPDEGANAK